MENQIENQKIKKQLKINLVRVVEKGEYKPELPNPIEQQVELVPCLIGKDEFPKIYKDHSITDEEFEEALDIIITEMMQRELHTITLDLDIRQRILEDRDKPMELTLEDLKHMFGRDVVIVQRKEEENGEQQSTN